MPAGRGSGSLPDAPLAEGCAGRFMSGLFDTPKTPEPGQCCPLCRHIVPHLPGLRASRKHPKVSHDAASIANLSLSSRAAAIIAHLEVLGRRGATDEEIDTHFGWGHQCTTPVMRALRLARIIGWDQDAGKNPILRKTQRNRPAHVNILAKFGADGFWKKPAKGEEAK